VASICAALLGRVKSGRGQHIDLALYDCLVSMHEYAVQSYTLSGGKELPVQTGHDLPMSTLYGVFTAADGHLVIAAQVDDSWLRLAKLVGDAAFAADTRFHNATGRNAHRLEILPVVRRWVAARSVSECRVALDAVDVACAKVQRIDEVLADPQIIARGMIIEQEHPILGRIRMPNLPFRSSAYDAPTPAAAPLMGQHNRAIAAGLGYTEAAIDTLVRDGVLYAESAVNSL
jgi:crotonobetainyl-CoA:carnitine CoA-transferase CaiB-like acyl-CoA transferase